MENSETKKYSSAFSIPTESEWAASFICLTRFLSKNRFTLFGKRFKIAYFGLLTSLIFALPNFAIGQNANPAIVTPLANETAASRAIERIDELEAQIRAMTDKMEKLEAASEAQKLENQRLAKLLDENSAKLIALQEKGLAKTEEKPVAPPVIDTQKADAEKIDAPKPIDIPPPQPIPAPITNAEVKKEVPAPIILSAAQYLDNAKLSIQSSEYDKAISNLSDLLKNHQTAPEATEARWLLGETYFVRAEWLNAAKSYIEYLQKDKKGPKVSDVLVRLASSYRELGDNKQRCLAIKAYKDRTPSPSAILKARADDEIAKGPCP